MSDPAAPTDPSCAACSHAEFNGGRCLHSSAAFGPDNEYHQTQGQNRLSEDPVACGPQGRFYDPRPGA